MATGKIADTNVAPLATLSAGTATAAGLGLANMQTMDRFLTLPTRFTTPAAAQFDAVLDRSRRVSLLGVMFHTLSRLATYRLTVAIAGGTLAAPYLQTAWLPVYPRISRSMSLSWSDPSWWSGQVSAEEIDLHSRHLWIPLASPIAATAIRLEFADSTNTAGFFDVGGLWISGVVQTTVNFDRGRERGREARGIVDETPSGRRLYERRAGRRTLSASWSGLTDEEAGRFTDLAARTEDGRPVVFLADSDDIQSCAREGYLAEVTVKGPTLTYSGLNTASISLKEIIA